MLRCRSSCEHHPLLRDLRQAEMLAIPAHATILETRNFNSWRPAMSNKPAIVPQAAVAVIGLGNMGVPMGACLMRAGYAVTGFDILESARRKFESAGGRTANELTGAVAADVVITVLPNGKIVREAVRAMRPHLRNGAILVDMSSSDPLGTRILGEE